MLFAVGQLWSNQAFCGSSTCGPAIGDSLMTVSQFIELLPIDSRASGTKLIDWIASKHGEFHWSAKEWCCHTFSHRENEGRPKYPLFYITPSATVKIYPSRLYSRPKMSPSQYPPFNDIETRQNLVQRIDRLTRERVPKDPDAVRVIELVLLDDDRKFTEFCDIVNWMTEEIGKS